jgi:ribonucleotide reductase beta subunit family protein with ferritin-like domain
MAEHRVTLRSETNEQPAIDWIQNHASLYMWLRSDSSFLQHASERGGVCNLPKSPPGSAAIHVGTMDPHPYSGVAGQLCNPNVPEFTMQVDVWIMSDDSHVLRYTANHATAWNAENQAQQMNPQDEHRWWWDPADGGSFQALDVFLEAVCDTPGEAVLVHSSPHEQEVVAQIDHTPTFEAKSRMARQFLALGMRQHAMVWGVGLMNFLADTKALNVLRVKATDIAPAALHRHEVRKVVASRFREAHPDGQEPTNIELMRNEDLQAAEVRYGQAMEAIHTLHIMVNTIVFFGVSDDPVIENYGNTLRSIIKNPQLLFAIDMQVYIENIHVMAYTLLTRLVIPNIEMRRKLLQVGTTRPSVRAKAKWSTVCTAHPLTSLAQKFLNSALVELLFFQAAFAIIFFFRGRLNLEDMFLVNDFVLRDENHHGRTAIEVLKWMVKRIPLSVFYSMLRRGSHLEKLFCQESFTFNGKTFNLAGLSGDSMQRFVEFTANVVCAMAGVPPLFRTKSGAALENPVPAAANQSATRQYNIHERATGDYAMPVPMAFTIRSRRTTPRWWRT